MKKNYNIIIFSLREKNVGFQRHTNFIFKFSIPEISRRRFCLEAFSIPFAVFFFFIKAIIEESREWKYFPIGLNFGGK